MLTALIDQEPLVTRFLRQCPQNLSGFSFVNLFAWQEFWHYDLRTVHENLCIFARHELGIFLYLPPLGRAIDPRTPEDCFRIMNDINVSRGYSRVENVSEHLLAAFPAERFRHYLKGYEYCYYRDDIARLQGNAYKSKRWSCNAFVRNYRFRYLAFDPGMTEECCALYDSWAGRCRKLHADDLSQHLLNENRGVHRLVMQNALRLGLTGRVVEVDGRIRAYTFGYPVNENVFCVLFEIADTALKGLPVFVFKQFCDDPQVRPYKFINVMDDSGLDHLARVKLSFRPRVLLPSYTVTEK